MPVTDLIYRQVTDLERKLRHAKLEVSNLQSQMQRQRLFALEDSEWAETTWRRNSNESDVADSFPTHDFRRVREEIIQRSSGLFNVPPAWRESVTDAVGDDISVSPQALPRPTLPPLKFAQHLLHLFETEIFAICPYHDLPTFVNQTKELYNNIGGGADIPPNTSRSWLVLFFATLALTCHCIQDETIAQHYATEGKSATPIGRDLADSAAYFFGPITKINTLDDVRGALTLSIYFKQMNELSASNIWLGLSCKIAQFLGTLHLW